ncbi:MAG: exosortase/archaeosortase family protein [Verrucomicrobiota bacterium]|nr:exosortase/archaeosortase family protein [Verrucomicrobiota bacterium]
MAFRNRFFEWLVPAALWLWLFYHLHDEWTLNPEYNYGWTVPLLVAPISFLRWRRRPPAFMPPIRAFSSAVSWMILLILLPLRVLEVANPDWRLLSWVLALLVVSFTLIFFLRIGGKEWLRHFAFPVCFVLAAVPWPVRMENFVVQHLMRIVTYFAVEIAGWIGVAAYQIGNVIQLRNGFVGVDDACSGVRTLQAGITVSLVLGELLQLRPTKRFVLIFCGALWVFACNVVRATTLMILAANGGSALLARWHDLIGTLAVVAGMAGLIGLAWLWKTNSAPASRSSKEPIVIRSLAQPWLALAWLCLVFGATEFWYRSHEKGLIDRPSWRAKWPEANGTLRQLPIPEATRVILRYDDARSATWEDPRGVLWWSFFARWKPARTALQLIRSHSPEICLPAIGRTFRGQLPRLTTHAGAVPLDFRAYEFEQNGRPLFVFVCLQEDKMAASSSTTDEPEWNMHGRLRAAWLGQRNLGQRLLEIAVTGFDGFPEAREAAERMVSGIVATDESTR